MLRTDRSVTRTDLATDMAQGQPVKVPDPKPVPEISSAPDRAETPLPPPVVPLTSTEPELAATSRHSRPPQRISPVSLRGDSPYLEQPALLPRMKP